MRTTTFATTAALLFASTSHAQISSPCADIAEHISERNLTTPKSVLVPAITAVQCLRSVPIDRTAARQWIQSYNASLLQFQSTSAYLKDPPPSYQQPAVDLQSGLNKIRDNLEAGRYGNEYDFEADFYRLTQSAHDGHFGITTGAIFPITFSGPYPLISLSRDGREAPSVYALPDLSSVSNTTHNWTASPLQSINGQDAVEYLKELAANFSTGGLEAHVDWNNLMLSAAGRLAGDTGLFSSLPLYPGMWFNATFANGTSLNSLFVAEVTKAAVPVFANITSGRDFYKAFVQLPDKTEASATATASGTATAAATSTAAASTNGAISRWPIAAYPEPFIVQDGLGLARGSGESATQGWVTGYMLQDISLAVLSIPSFSMTGRDAQTFSTVVEGFLSQSKQAGIKRILIDVQANGGGDALLSTEIFKHFFPTKYAYGGSRFRVHDTANVLGHTYSDYITANKDNQTLVEEAKGSVWVAQNYIDATTGKSFDSWDQVSNGYSQKGDEYSVTQVDDFSDPTEALLSTGDDEGPGIVVYGYANRTNVSSQPYDAQDIAILTDGICASTCTTFIELFHHQAGVSVVAVGGNPSPGPMQGAGGVRGAQSYTLDGLTGDVETAAQLNKSTASSLRPIVDTGIQVLFGGFNLRDQVRENQTFPLQFEYAPADCRIYYTAETYNNYTALWRTAANALWNDSGMCVDGSTGKTSSNGTGTSSGGSGGTPTGVSSTASTGPSTAGASSLKIGLMATVMPALVALLV